MVGVRFGRPPDFLLFLVCKEGFSGRCCSLTKDSKLNVNLGFQSTTRQCSNTEAMRSTVRADVLQPEPLCELYIC